jgi:hypothetical protein
MEQFRQALRQAAGWFGLTREARRRPPSALSIVGLVLACLAGFLIAVISSGMLHSLGIVLFGGGLGSAVGATLRRRRAARNQMG